MALTSMSDSQRSRTGGYSIAVGTHPTHVADFCGFKHRRDQRKVQPFRDATQRWTAPVLDRIGRTHHGLMTSTRRLYGKSQHIPWLS
jgi:hypothetical protein